MYGQTPGQFCHPMVQKGHARFQAGGHGSAVYLTKNVIGQVTHCVSVHHAQLLGVCACCGQWVVQKARRLDDGAAPTTRSNYQASRVLPLRYKAAVQVVHVTDRLQAQCEFVQLVAQPGNAVGTGRQTQRFANGFPSTHWHSGHGAAQRLTQRHG